MIQTDRNAVSKNNRHPFRPKRLTMYILLILLAVVSFLPFYLMLINATRSTADIATGFSFFPGGNILQNFKEMQARVNVVGAFKNSALKLESQE